MKNKVLLILVLLTFILVGCQVADSYRKKNNNFSDDNIQESKDVLWINRELKNVHTSDLFRFGEFDNKIVLIESFAVWCPTCKKQHEEIKKIFQENNKNIIPISLNTDPNENEEEVLKYSQENNFNWMFTISDSSLTRGLIDVFGMDIVNAPSAAVILICEDKSYSLMKRGFKTVQELKSEINNKCLK